jgi:hypothetical protein
MSILENSDEMFFGRTEKSGHKKWLDCRTENGKEECNCFYAFFSKIPKSPKTKTLFWLHYGYISIT